MSNCQKCVSRCCGRSDRRAQTSLRENRTGSRPAVPIKFSSQIATFSPMTMLTADQSGAKADDER